MEVEYDEDDNPTVYVSKSDKCMICEYQYGCPLIECLGNGLVYMDEPIHVIDCEHYKLFNQ